MITPHMVCARFARTHVQTTQLQNTHMYHNLAMHPHTHSAVAGMDYMKPEQSYLALDNVV